MLVGLLVSFERMRELINLDAAIDNLSKANLGTTNALVTRAHVWIRNVEKKVHAVRTKFEGRVAS